MVWRQRKLMRRLTLSPVSVQSVIGARILVSLGIALAQTVLFVVVAVLAFHLQLSGAWWMAIPLVLAGTLAFLSIGLLAGALHKKSIEAASALANLIVIPMAFLSGAFIPINDVPSWVAVDLQVLPLRHLNDAVLDVLAWKPAGDCAARTGDSFGVRTGHRPDRDSTFPWGRCLISRWRSCWPRTNRRGTARRRATAGAFRCAGQLPAVEWLLDTVIELAPDAIGFAGRAAGAVRVLAEARPVLGQAISAGRDGLAGWSGLKATLSCLSPLLQPARA